MATGRDEHTPLARIEPSAVRKFLFDEMCESQIEIVAAEQQMIADRDAMELQPTSLTRSHMNQTEIRRTAADVAHEDCLAGRDDPVPFVAMRIHPGIERGLGFLQKYDTWQPGDSSGGHGQFPSDFIERRRNREYHFLLR